MHSAKKGMDSLNETYSLTISGTEDDDLAGQFDSHEEAEELVDLRVDNAETEATNAKLKQLDRFAECGVNE